MQTRLELMSSTEDHALTDRRTLAVSFLIWRWELDLLHRVDR